MKCIKNIKILGVFSRIVPGFKFLKIWSPVCTSVVNILSFFFPLVSLFVHIIRPPFLSGIRRGPEVLYDSEVLLYMGRGWVDHRRRGSSCARVRKKERLVMRELEKKRPIIWGTLSRSVRGCRSEEGQKMFPLSFSLASSYIWVLSFTFLLLFFAFCPSTASLLTLFGDCRIERAYVRSSPLNRRAGKQ